MTRADDWAMEYAEAVLKVFRLEVPEARMEEWIWKRLSEEIAEALDDVNDNALEIVGEK